MNKEQPNFTENKKLSSIIISAACDNKEEQNKLIMRKINEFAMKIGLSNPVLCSNLAIENIISIKMSSHNMIFLTEEGLVFKYGFKYVNNKKEVIYSNTPKMIKDIPLIKKISSCDANFSLLDYDGNIWTFGKYDIGLFLHGIKIDHSFLSNIEFPFIPTMVKRSDVKNVIDISEGGYRTFVKTQNGDIFYFFYNNPCCDVNKNYDILHKFDELF